MKFAVLALLGLVSGQQIESELTENIRKTYLAADVANAYRQLQSIGNTLEDMERSVTKEQHQQME